MISVSIELGTKNWTGFITQRPAGYWLPDTEWQSIDHGVCVTADLSCANKRFVNRCTIDLLIWVKWLCWHFALQRQQKKKKKRGCYYKHSLIIMSLLLQLIKLVIMNSIWEDTFELHILCCISPNRSLSQMFPLQGTDHMCCLFVICSPVEMQIYSPHIQIRAVLLLNCRSLLLSNHWSAVSRSYKI